MTLALSTATPNQSALTRPNDPRDPNGIAHSTSADTKADRVTAKLAWANYVQDYKQALKVGDSSGPPEFPDNGEITYAND
jgi:hypothetical protein